ncbi:MAG: hypothetical protein ACR2KC_01925, partial [Acidimicrobiales bacterium]
MSPRPTAGEGSPPEARLAPDAQAWSEALAALLGDHSGTPPPAGSGPRRRRPSPAERAGAFALRVPPGYREQTDPREAAFDLELLEAVDAGDPERLVVRAGESAAFHLRRYGTAGVELSGFLPVLESFGLVVVEAIPHHIRAIHPDQAPAHLDDFLVRLRRVPAGAAGTADGAAGTSA